MMDKPSEDAASTAEETTDPTSGEREPPGRATRDPEEGPARGGGSALEMDDEAAVEEIGGGD